MEGHEQIWNTCLEKIKQQINPQSYDTWFLPIKAVAVVGNILTIQVPNKFFYEWIESNYLQLMKECLTELLGPDAKLEYQVVLKDKRRDSSMGVKEVPKSFAKKEEDIIKNPFVIPGIRRQQIDPQLNKKYTFDNFIEGECNKLSRAAGLEVARNPGGTVFNPLVIYGNVGLGKTHLVQAIGNAVVQNFSKKNVLYVTTEKYTNQIIEALKKHEINGLINFYQNIDVLIIDDIQFLSGRAKTQEIFFNLFNHLHQLGKQIIITSDKPPKDLDDIQERLISRFKWGLSTELEIPEYDTRLKILLSKAANENIALPKDIAEYLAYNVSSNVRELEGALISVIAQSTLTQKELNLSLVKDVISRYVADVNHEISISQIKKLISNYYGIGIDQLEGASRKRDIVVARQLAIYLAKQHSSETLKGIGKEFGNRDHTTIMHSCKSVVASIETDSKFAAEVEDIEKQVSLSLLK